MKKDKSSNKDKKAKKKYAKPSFQKHGKLGRMVVAMASCCVTERLKDAVKTGSRRKMHSLLGDLAVSR
jgi:hypothetical protein